MLCTWLCIGAACAGVFAGGVLVLLAARVSWWQAHSAWGHNR